MGVSRKRKILDYINPPKGIEKIIKDAKRYLTDNEFYFLSLLRENEEVDMVKELLDLAKRRYELRSEISYYKRRYVGNPQKIRETIAKLETRIANMESNDQAGTLELLGKKHKYKNYLADIEAFEAKYKDDLAQIKRDIQNLINSYFNDDAKRRPNK